MKEEIIYREKYGAASSYEIYQSSGEKISKKVATVRSKTALFSHLKKCFSEVFLPQGYPTSVSSDYLHYQVWDTIQAFFSTIMGILTLQSVMTGVGVGSTTATAFSAAIAWILKDGAGMIGKILFAWLKGSQFDSNCKKWRLFADFINDIAMSMELLLPYYTYYSTEVLCISTALKSLVGVAGGATRAALTQHQAIRENMADVSAKDGSQETCVNLLASCVGVFLLSTFNDTKYVLPMFSLLAMCHMYANFRAVRSLNMVTLNEARFIILLNTYLISEKICLPPHVNLGEAIVLGTGMSAFHLCGFNIKLGTSIKESQVVSVEDIKALSRFYRHRDYLLCYVAHSKERTIFVFLNQGATSQDILQAYYHAVLLGIAVCLTSNTSLPIITEKKTALTTYPARRLQSSVVKYTAKGYTKLDTAMQAADDIITNEFPKFLSELEKNGWNINSHHLEVEEWRSDWSRDQVDEQDHQEEVSQFKSNAVHEHLQ